MSKGTFVISLFILNDILLLTNILSKHLQGKECTLAKSTGIINGTILSLEQKRNEKSFLSLWGEIKTLANKHEISLESPRSSKRKKTESKYLKGFAVLSTIGANEDEMPIEIEPSESGLDRTSQFWLINIFYRVLDSIINHMKIRFSPESQQFALSVDNFLKLDFEGSDLFIRHYVEAFAIQKDVLKAEMLVARNCIKSELSDWDINEIQKIMKKETFPNVFKLMQIALTIPVSSATCERSFSTMRRIKNWLRSRMSQDRFSNLSLINIESEMVGNLNLDDVLKQFVKQKNRKLDLNV